MERLVPDEESDDTPFRAGDTSHANPVRTTTSQKHHIEGREDREGGVR